MDAHDNIYAPPQVPLETRSAERPALPPFYVVSLRKLVLLSIATVGLYSLYWFWRHWKLHKLDRKLDIWPVPRAIFAIFFAHGLNEKSLVSNVPWALEFWHGLLTKLTR